MEVATLDARSGQPIAGAKVSFYSSYDEKNRKAMAEVPVSYTHLDVYKRQTYLTDKIGMRLGKILDFLYYFTIELQIDQILSLIHI